MRGTVLSILFACSICNAIKIHVTSLVIVFAIVVFDVVTVLENIIMLFDSKSVCKH